MSQFNEHPDAGDEWIAKALMLGGTVRRLDNSVWGILWSASIPDHPVFRAEFFGVTQARACRKLVRAITGVEG